VGIRVCEWTLCEICVPVDKPMLANCSMCIIAIKVYLDYVPLMVIVLAYRCSPLTPHYLLLYRPQPNPP
jgi:hypothetical protein